MEKKEQIKKNGSASEKQQSGEALSDEALDQVSGGMTILLGDEAAATKNYRGE